MFAWDALPSPSRFFGRPSAAGRRGELRMTHLIFNHSICKSAIGRKKSTRDVQRLRRTFALIGVSPTRLKGWVYAGFAITLVSALIAYMLAGILLLLAMRYFLDGDIERLRLDCKTVS